MTETLPKLLLRLSEGGASAELSGRQARRFFGPEFDRLLARRVLVEQRRLDMWSPCSVCTCAVEGRPIQTVSGRLVAACPLDAAADVLLNEEDVRVFAIDRANIVQEIARASGSVEPATQLLPDVWQVTTLPSGGPVIMILNDALPLDPLFLPALRARVRAVPRPVLLIPDIPGEFVLLLIDAGLRAIASSRLLKPDWSIAFGLMQEDVAGARIVIRRSTRSVEVDGRALSLSDQLFRTLLLLAEAVGPDGRYLDRHYFEDQLWKGLTMPESREVRDIIRDLRSALREGGPLEAPELIETKRNPTRYRLALGTEEVSLLP